MTTANLLIGYPDIQEACTEYESYSTASGTNSPNEQDLRPVYNTMGGKRHYLWQSAGTYSEHNIVYDLGPNGARPVDFWCLSKLRYLKETAASSQVKFELYRSDNGSSWTVEQIESDLSALSLLGPWSSDYLKLLSVTGSYRYWRARFAKTAGPDFAVYLGKIFFGQILDLLQDPFEYEINRVSPEDATFISDAGSPWAVRLALPQYQFTFRWKNITTAKLAEFYQNIFLNRHRNPVFLYTASYHAILDEQRLVHCRLVDAYTDNRYQVTDRNFLEARFVEVHG